MVIAGFAASNIISPLIIKPSPPTDCDEEGYRCGRRDLILNR